MALREWRPGLREERWPRPQVGRRAAKTSLAHGRGCECGASAGPKSQEAEDGHPFASGLLLAMVWTPRRPLPVPPLGSRSPPAKPSALI